MPDQLTGHILQWNAKSTFAIKLHFNLDNAYDNCFMSQVLRPSFNFHFILGKNGTQIPTLSERTRLRAGEPEEAAAPEAERTFVDIEYTEGGETKTQRWFHEQPTAIAQDARTAERFPASLNVPLQDVQTPFKMFLFAALPPKFVAGCVAYFNTRGKLGRPGHSFAHRECTTGEIVKWFCIILTLCLYPGDPVAEMWHDKMMESDLLGPPCLGQYGICKNRHELFMSLFSKLYDESELLPDSHNKDDKWRFCDFWMRMFNEHMAIIIKASWLLAPDEGMSPWDAEAGPNPDQIPHSSFVPRKPKDVGGEIKMTMDGVSGVLLFCEVMKGAASHGGLEYADDWSYTQAMNLRLSKQWHVTAANKNPNRVYMADSHFSGVDEVECMLLKVLLLLLISLY